MGLGVADTDFPKREIWSARTPQTTAQVELMETLRIVFVEAGYVRSLNNTGTLPLQITGFSSHKLLLKRRRVDKGYLRRRYIDMEHSNAALRDQVAGIALVVTPDSAGNATESWKTACITRYGCALFKVTGCLSREVHDDLASGAVFSDRQTRNINVTKEAVDTIGINL